MAETDKTPKTLKASRAPRTKTAEKMLGPLDGAPRVPKGAGKIVDERERIRGTRQDPIKQEVSGAETVNRFYRQKAAEQGNYVRSAEYAPRIAAAQAQTTAKQTRDRLDMDFEALREQRPEDVQDWKELAAMTVSLGSAGDEKAEDLQNALMWTYGDQLKPHVESLQPGWWDDNKGEKPKVDKSLFQKFVGGLGKAGEYLDQAGQSTLSAIAGIEAAIDQDDDVSFLEGVTHAYKQVMATGDITKWAAPGTGGITGKLGWDPTSIKTGDGEVSLDQDGNESINVREAIGLDHDAGGKWGGVFDLLGSIVLDPTTWITLGQGNLAKAGMKGVEKYGAEVLAKKGAMYGDELIDGMFFKRLNATIKANGFDSLEKGLQDIYVDALDGAVKHGVTSSKKGIIDKLAGNTVQEGQLRQIKRGGQEGVRFAGKTVVPTDRVGSKLGKGREVFGTEEVLHRTVNKPGLELPGAAKTVPDEVTRIGDDVLRNTDSTILSRGDSMVDDAAAAIKNKVPDRIKYVPDNRAGRRSVEGRKQLAKQIDEAIDAAEGVPLSSGTRREVAELVDEFPDEVLQDNKFLRAQPDYLGVKGVDWDEKLVQKVIRLETQKGLAGEILDIPKVQQFVAALKPRTYIKALFGEDVAERVGRLFSITADSDQSKDIFHRLGLDMRRGGLRRNVLDEFGKGDAAATKFNTIMDRALTAKGPERAAILAGQSENFNEYFKVMDNVRRELYDMALKGGANAEHLRDIETYLPRVLTDASRENAKLMDELTNLAADGMPRGSQKVADRFMNRRSIAPDIDSLVDSNAEAERVLKHAGVTHQGDLYETDIASALYLRAESAAQTMRDRDLMHGLTKIEGNNGKMLAFHGKPWNPLDEQGNVLKSYKRSGVESVEQQLKAAGEHLKDYQLRRLDDGSVYAIHDTVAKEMEDIRRIFGSPKELGAVGELLQTMNNMWARSATVFGINSAFHIRNGMGNVFLAFQGGTKDFSVYKRALSIQTDLTKAETVMSKTGKTFDQALREVGMHADDIKVVKLARKEGVLSDGRTQDVVRNLAGRGGGGNLLDGPKNAAMKGLDAANKPGMAIGTGIENNARLGVFIDQLNKGSDAATAGIHVKKYLFDYGDLTRFETDNLRTVSRFYTFLRKNIGVQAYTLAKYPGRTNIAEKTSEAFVDAMAGELMQGEDGKYEAPPWMPGAGVYNLAMGGGTAAISIDTPFKSFEDFIDIFIAPSSDNPLEQLGAQQGVAGFASRVSELFSGVVPSAIDFMWEMESGRDAFTGRALDPENQFRDTSFFRALRTVLPGVGRFEKYAAQNEWANEKWGVRLDKDGKPTGVRPWVAQVMGSFTGLTVYPVGEDTEGIGKYVLIKELQKVMDEMREDGIEVPTVAELRKSGELEMKNRVVETLMYGWKKNPETGELEWDNAEANGKLLQLIPKDMRDAFIELGVLEPEDNEAAANAGQVTDKGGRPDAPEGSEEEAKQKEFDLAQARLATETFLGRELTEEERYTMASVLGGLTYTEQENMGLNPYRRNKLKGGAEEAEVDDLAARDAQFDRVLESMGLTRAGVLGRNPRISTMQKNIEDARAAGWSDDEIRNAMYYAEDEGGKGWLSRKDKGNINQMQTGKRDGGAVPLTMTRYPTVDDEDLSKIQTKAWQASEELKWVHIMEGWPPPSQEQLFMYGVDQLTKTEQRALGIDPFKGAPNRKDVRPDSVKDEQSSAKLGAVRTGLAEGAATYSPQNQPDYKPWDYD